MNLIEQLGGYSIAKTEYKMPVKLRNIDYEQLAIELLKYRRENNIFEVGDKVVDTDGFFDWLCKVDYLSTDGRVVMYKHDQRRGDTAFSTWSPIRRVRHATDEEIKAGKRL